MTETTNPEQEAPLTQLIERHRAAYNALSRAIDDHEDEPHHPAVDAAIDADEGALFELCSYRCESIEKIMKKFLIILMATCMFASIANAWSRPNVPIMVYRGEAPACAYGVVAGLNPHGDGFLAVKSAPNINSERIDKLYNGQEVFFCSRNGDWIGTVYTKKGNNCNVSQFWDETLPYTGPCFSGWAYKNWLYNVSDEGLYPIK